MDISDVADVRNAGCDKGQYEPDLKNLEYVSLLIKALYRA
jgi:hypothetical protein